MKQASYPQATTAGFKNEDNYLLADVIIFRNIYMEGLQLHSGDTKAGHPIPAI